MSLVGFKVQAIEHTNQGEVDKVIEGVVIEKYIGIRRAKTYITSNSYSSGTVDVNNPIPVEFYIIQQANLTLVHTECRNVKGMISDWKHIIR